MSDTHPLSDVRQEIARIIIEAAHYDEDDVNVLPFAERILAIPEIAEALGAKKTVDHINEKFRSGPLGP